MHVLEEVLHGRRVRPGAAPGNQGPVGQHRGKGPGGGVEALHMPLGDDMNPKIGGVIYPKLLQKTIIRY